jgi:hypothetical protein
MINKPFIVLSTVAALGLSACDDPATRIQDPSYRAQNGALIGAVGGAALGGMLGGSKNSVLTGALVGGLGGALIGNNLDQQAAEMRNRLGNPNVTVTNMGGYLLVNLPDDVLFASGSAALRPYLQGEVRSIAANLVSYPSSNIEVVGHTDEYGPVAAPRLFGGQCAGRRRGSAEPRVDLWPGRGSADCQQPDRRRPRAEPPGRDHHSTEVIRAFAKRKGPEHAPGLFRSVVAFSAVWPQPV